MTHYLIANSGIQFIESELTLNPNSTVNDEKGMPMIINCGESVDPFTQTRKFSFLTKAGTDLIPVDELFLRPEGIATTPGGIHIYGFNGLPKTDPHIQSLYYTVYTPGQKTEDSISYGIQTLNGFQVHPAFNEPGLVPAFNLLLDKWLPIPLFEKGDGGMSNEYPTGWCRLKITLKERKQKGEAVYRLLWAIDTSLSDNPMLLNRPYFSMTDGKTKEFGICNRTENLQRLYFTMDYDMSGKEVSVPTPETKYLAGIFNIDLERQPMDADNPNDLGKFKFLAYYSYFVNVLRVLSPLNVTLCNRPADQSRPVDLVMDIGNSRTCALLFEEGNFSKRQKLELRDLSEPWIVYDKDYSFDMRLVFRRPDFGIDIANDQTDDSNPLFNWCSPLRLGKEAKKLIYRSMEDAALFEKVHTCSSPKRYLWDEDRYPGNWTNLVTITDPLAHQQEAVYSAGLTNYLDETGKYMGQEQFFLSEECHYSRSSLMLLAFVEIFSQAFCQINSEKFRDAHGEIDLPRYLRDVVITCPTAMSNAEQMKLRALAQDALEILSKGNFNHGITATVIPNASAIKTRPQYDIEAEKSWVFDEATSCQLVYLYAELKNRYEGNNELFFSTRGHIREDLKADGITDKPSLTVASIDIGAGTTDLMICAYVQGDNDKKITPIPLFWDSFYLAGDDLLSNIVKCIIIEGDRKGDRTSGSILSVLEARLKDATDTYFTSRLNHFSKEGKPAYIHLTNNIIQAASPSERQEAISAYARNLLIDFFGIDSANLNWKDRRFRADFNTQISVPIAQFFLELKKQNRQAKTYRFEDIFQEYQPSNQLLDHFKEHFDFDIREIEWNFSPEEIKGEILKTFKPLMRQIAMIVHKFKADILMLAGRPTSIADIPDIFFDYYPLSPDRVVRLDEYEVGNWYPFATGEGRFYDQKSVVAVGAYIGHLCNNGGFGGMELDLSKLADKMRPTANYIGEYQPHTHTVDPIHLSPDFGTINLKVSTFPYFLGCKQLKSVAYESRPLFKLDLTEKGTRGKTYSITLTRQWNEDCEKVEILDITDSEGNSCPGAVSLSLQSLVDTDTGLTRFWLDDGAFKFL